MVLDHVTGHVAPAETAEQEFQSRRQIGEAPEMVADDAAAQVLGKGRSPGQRELDVALQRFAGDRLLRPGQRMVGGYDRDECDRGEKFRGNVRGRAARRAGRSPCAPRRCSRVSSAPPSASVKTVAGSFGKAPRSAREASHQQRHREGRRRPRASIRARRPRRCSGRAHAAPWRCRTIARASRTIAAPASVRVGVFVDRSNSGTPSVVSMRLNGLADRRLHAPESSRELPRNCRFRRPRRARASGRGSADRSSITSRDGYLAEFCQLQRWYDKGHFASQRNN